MEREREMCLNGVETPKWSNLSKQDVSPRHWVHHMASPSWRTSGSERELHSAQGCQDSSGFGERC